MAEPIQLRTSQVALAVRQREQFATEFAKFHDKVRVLVGSFLVAEFAYTVMLYFLNNHTAEETGTRIFHLSLRLSVAPAPDDEEPREH